MKILLVFLLIFATARSYSQTAGEQYIIGKWKVVSSEFFYAEVPSCHYYRIDKLQRLSLTAIFEFKSNHLFNLKIKNKLIEIHNAYWKYNPAHNSYIVQNWKDRLTPEKVLIKIYVKTNRKFKYWVVDEPYAGRLMVKKISSKNPHYP